MVTQEQVLEALKSCFDPEIPVSIVDLGLVYGVKIEEGKKVLMTMTLTTRGCGMAHNIALDAKQKILKVPGVEEASVTVVWDPPWTPERMSPAAKQKLGMA
ncbi:MAG: DUF59 domain-containing protein [Candidatus Omnitrophica bacterium]|nr:DUF59 domain-containing protein [Candidatus Omnitrophota bacterium]